MFKSRTLKMFEESTNINNKRVSKNVHGMLKLNYCKEFYFKSSLQ